MARMRDRTGGQNRQVSSRAVPAAALRPPLCAFQVRGVRGSGHGDGRAQPDHPDPAVPQRLVLPLDRLLLCDGEHFGERPAPLRSLPLTPPPPALSRPQLAGSCWGGVSSLAGPPGPKCPRGLGHSPADSSCSRTWPEPTSCLPRGGSGTRRQGHQEKVSGAQCISPGEETGVHLKQRCASGRGSRWLARVREREDTLLSLSCPGHQVPGVPSPEMPANTGSVAPA